MRWLRWISGIVWIFCWYTLYLEVFRWHHMTKWLRFNPRLQFPERTFSPKRAHPSKLCARVRWLLPWSSR